ncbi:MAG: NAD(P)/FAD-dependent oxidoreductase [Ruminococcaceae bacterium]|nr:NAD(P)/FAD-dependent oxidoreductase [Oscillospiraceae bacterium]
MLKRLVIIGGGAAGTMAAISAASQLENTACDITIIEKNSRLARKVMITGRGRCNVTNNCDLETLIANTPKNGKFLYSAFSAFSASDVMSFFENHKVPLKTERGNRVFPVSDKAVDIVDALAKAVKSNGVSVVEGAVAEIITEENAVKGVLLDDGRTFGADAVILSTGGASYPLTGSTGDGYIIAQKLGHTITPITASLIPLECHEGFCSRLSGLSLKNVTLSVYEEGKRRPVFSEMGEMLFTHFGISGPLVLSASAHLRDIEKRNYTAVIDLKPALSAEQLDKRILRDFEETLNRDFINSLDKLLPKSLIPVVVSLTGIAPDTKVNSISRAERQRLCDVIKSLTLHITRSRPVEEAIITRGGISVKEIVPGSMSSKIIENLYFAGEIIDVDAYTGGFNLQIAFSTGFLAGKSAVQNMLGE